MAPTPVGPGEKGRDEPMSDRDDIRQLVLAAGKTALRMRAGAAVHRKADRSFVTDADLAVQAYLIDELRKRYPQDGFVAEEQDVGRGRQSARRLWVLDPIDGTASYASGLPGWGVSVGLVEDGRAAAGWFHMPVTGEVFEAGQGIGMQFARAPEDAAAATGLLTPRPLGRHTSIFVDSRFNQRFTLGPSFPGKVRSLGTTVGHLAYVAAGCADAAVLHDVHVWDFAAGLAMLNEAGGVMRYLDDGADVDVADYLAGEDAVRPMLAGHPETVARLAKLIATRE